MNDSTIEIKVTITKADFVGTCLRCGEPSCGSFDCDDENKYVTLKCVNCGYKQLFEMHPNQEFNLIEC